MPSFPSVLHHAGASRHAEVCRRTLLHGAVVGGVLAMTGAQAGCSTGPATRSSVPTQRAEGPARVLVVYFSRAGENYHYGDRIELDVGNTEVLAGVIGARLDELGVAHDVHRLEAADPYPDDYDATVPRNSEEQDADARPGVANPLASIDQYDVVLIGSPIWNVRPPMIMRTFAEAHDLAGATVHPFVTYAVSGPGATEDEYGTACPGADIRSGLAVRGETVRDDAPAAVAGWLDRMDLT